MFDPALACNHAQQQFLGKPALHKHRATLPNGAIKVSSCGPPATEYIDPPKDIHPTMELESSNPIPNTPWDWHIYIHRGG